jgi:hypothetical protein
MTRQVLQLDLWIKSLTGCRSEGFILVRHAGQVGDTDASEQGCTRMNCN